MSNCECNHVWRYRKDGWVEGCVPAICIKCRKFGCTCDMKEDVDRYTFFAEGIDSRKKE